MFFSIEHFREHFREHPPRRVLLDNTKTGVKAKGEKMMEKLLDIEITEYGTVTEEIELICTMTGFRSRFLVHHMGEGFFRSVALGPS
jgi:hypothetical protein